MCDNNNYINQVNKKKTDISMSLLAHVTICKRIILIINQKILTFNDDIRAELYLKIYNLVYLPRRIDTLMLHQSKGCINPCNV